MFNPLELKKRFVQSQIEKAFSDDIEKAKYQVGQPHPNNPNIVWTEWRPGQFDWKSKNGRYWKNKGGSTQSSDNASKEQKFKQSFKDASDDVLQKVVDGKIQASSEEKKWAQDIIDERKASNVKTKAAKKIIDLLKVASSKYTDISKVVAWKTDRGNYYLDYDGAETGITVDKDVLSDKDFENAGVKIEGANANSKNDSDLINDIKSNEDAFIEACGLSNIKRVVSIRETPTSVFIKYENKSGQEQEFPLTKNVANSVLKEVKAEKSKKTDPRDKVAQKAGFKDYEEMSGYQEYVTTKNLLKKPSMQAKTKQAEREALEKRVAKYEKEHADVIKRVDEKKGGKKKNDDSDVKSKQSNQIPTQTNKDSFLDKVVERVKSCTFTRKLSDEQLKSLKYAILHDKASIKQVLGIKFPSVPAYSGLYNHDESEITLDNGRVLKILHSADVQTDRVGQEYTHHEYEIKSDTGKLLGRSTSTKGYTTPSEAKQKTINQALFNLFCVIPK